MNRRPISMLILGILIGMATSAGWGYGTPAYRWAHSLHPIIDLNL